jgi:hypothetical protein
VVCFVVTLGKLLYNRVLIDGNDSYGYLMKEQFRLNEEL